MGRGVIGRGVTTRTVPQVGAALGPITQNTTGAGLALHFATLVGKLTVDSLLLQAMTNKIDNFLCSFQINSLDCVSNPIF